MKLEKIEVKNSKLSAAILLVIMAAICVYISTVFLSQRKEEPLYPSGALTEKKMLSDYYDGLKGKAVDTEVYIFRGKKPGATMLLLGGTHPTETSGYVASVLVMENAVPEEGTLIVIPRTNRSGFTCTEPQDATPLGVHIETDNGTRYFRIGCRLTNPVHQWPDPDIYYHNAGQLLTGKETRNVDRTYPGRTDGNLTEKVNYGLVQLINAENVDVTIDLHEGPPEYPTIDVMIAHQRAMDLAGMTVLNMAFEGLNIRVDASPLNYHGFSHRELGDHTGTLAMLAETANPVQGRLVGHKSEELMLLGKDKFYHYASENSHRLYTDYPEEGKPLNMRVARHVEMVRQIAEAYNMLGTGKSFEITEIPGYAEIMENGMGKYLAPKTQ